MISWWGVIGVFGGMITFVLLIAGFMLLADKGRGYNFLSMDDGSEDDDQKI